MCDGTLCPCNLYGGVDDDDHRRRHPRATVGLDVPRRSVRALELANDPRWWRRTRARLRCGRTLGHCVHLSAAMPLAPLPGDRYYCCECPATWTFRPDRSWCVRGRASASHRSPQRNETAPLSRGRGGAVRARTQHTPVLDASRISRPGADRYSRPSARSTARRER